MKKKVFMLVMVAVFGLTLLAEVKIGVVNPAYVLENTNKGKRILEELKELTEGKQKQMNRLQNEIKNLREDLQKPLNEATKEEKSILLQKKQTELQRFVKDSQSEIQMRQQRSMVPYQQEIMPLIQEYCEKNNFTLVLDVSGAGVAYFDEAIDISPDIVKLVNEKIK